jgi:hypothetical protein
MLGTSLCWVFLCMVVYVSMFILYFSFYIQYIWQMNTSTTPDDLIYLLEILSVTKKELHKEEDWAPYTPNDHLADDTEEIPWIKKKRIKEYYGDDIDIHPFFHKKNSQGKHQCVVWRSCYLQQQAMWFLMMNSCTL